MGVIREYPPLYVNPRYGYIQEIAVTQKQRRRKIGTRLFERMVKWFSEQGVARMELDVVHANKAARRFWASVGFEDHMIKKWQPVPK